MDNWKYLEEFAKHIEDTDDVLPTDVERFLAHLDDTRANTRADATAESEPVHRSPRAHQEGAHIDLSHPKSLDAPTDSAQISLQSKVDRLIWSYRYYGYLSAQINPLGEYVTPELRYLFYTIEGIGDYLSYHEHGITDDDLATEVECGAFIKPSRMPLKELIEVLKRIYCNGIGLETLHIQNRNMRRWIISKLEAMVMGEGWSSKKQQRFQKDLIKAEEFEKFVHANFIGQKRFSLEGGESLVPALRYLIDTAYDHDIREIVFGMPHRGRLNVFTNALRKRAADTFSDFIGAYKPYIYGGSGDVKYHLGHNFSIDFGNNRSIHLSLVANPSHLEAVDAVVEGKCRGIQRRRNDRHRKRIMPVLIHGDAAFSGQGVVSEVFNLSQLRGYKTGGTIHIILNNQIGFTTSSRDARSTFFSSDIAKILPIPILHVNGDDPESVMRGMRLALLYRQKFSFDVVVDIICYRRLGHNEADEPSFTHPMMYKIIQSHDSARTQYGRRLAELGIFTAQEQQEFAQRYTNVLKEELRVAHRGHTQKINDAFQVGEWKNFKHAHSFKQVPTGVPAPELITMAEKMALPPAGFSLNPKLTRLLNDRQRNMHELNGIDWSFAEQLAFGSLLREGYSIRLSGEDCARGTFSQRHAIWWDVKSSTPRAHTPLHTVQPQGVNFSVYDSPLSEFAVLGFEYGYSLAQPNILVIWEAQFGDFVNGAQVIIDQFVAAAQKKWHRFSGLVMLLPHAYEGQGPEHSSAHLERFLQLCAEDNMQIVNPSTPAQYFHMLRRQMKQNFRLPLIVMTPKSLLRHKLCRSSLDELTTGSFRLVIDDHDADPKTIHRLIVSSGHHYYDLLAERERRDAHNVALVRLEQFYPFPRAALRSALARYSRETTVVWSQEESRNRGAHHFLVEGMNGILTNLGFQTMRTAGRLESASPATGSFTQHSDELQAVLQRAFEV